MPNAHFFIDRIRLLGAIALVIAIITWAVDISGLVYACPYCRTQRTAIGLLGILMMLPRPGHWLSLWLGTVVASLGMVVAATQNFGGWKKIWAGSFSLGEQWYINSFLLSGAAMFILSAQLLLLFAVAARYRLPAPHRVPGSPS